ncbi:hypothetical protein GCM10011504_50290 [Siccirubricoccus deserti]|uniref:Uncharacterized protein n=1 Tax=Siccirubricoccus deserti TaxID=2013562 RepID=A0A9X0R4T6_9PROT|nr:hypothetical protein [Siccirubricoccus deserti]MBC4018513.1 hypothetical protein [Siccirubricoccus deserti]GGC66263.1 hypothetical protein GCM10011504_50290 [Siccirubricoccus deserti]
MRQDIDSGATGDKVPVLDPSHVAARHQRRSAGAPPSPELVAAVRQAERTQSYPPEHPHDRGGSRLGLRLLWCILLVAALASAAIWLSSG